MQPALILPDGPVSFPNPAAFDDEGLIAVGGDLSEPRLLEAYSSGIFPWYSEGYPPLWWCPNPRTVLPLDDLHISRSMKRCLRKRDFEITWNRAFDRVVQECASNRVEGTWVLPEMISAYCGLHTSGRAYSIEVWRGQELVGGLYGVQRGGLFAAESMFHRATDMSKVALLFAASNLRRAGIQLFDVQFLTPHLATLGAKEIPRSQYLDTLKTQRTRSVDLTGLKLTSPVDS